jgi:beta-lactamase superfamily II metal-dependent hydrolase
MRSLLWQKGFPVVLIGAIITGIVLANVCPWEHPATTDTTEWTTYHNAVYGYSIEYPEDWELDDSDVSWVVISSEEHFAIVNIGVHDYPLSLEVEVDFWMDNFVYKWENVEVLSSHKPETRWDWVITYRYTFDGIQIYDQAYFLQTPDYTFIIDYAASSEGGAYSLCQEFVNTFTDTAEWTSYHSEAYDYNIEYPAQWVLNDENPSNVEIYNEQNPEEEPILINIFANDWLMPLDEWVDFFIEVFVYDPNNEQPKILINREGETKWDWVIAYEFTYDTAQCYAEAYFLETSDYTFTIHLLNVGQVGETFDLCREIANTFQPPPDSSFHPDTLSVHFIDVGQGDSILIDLGETEALIDGGGKSSGVVSYLHAYVDGELEVMVATHPDADHIGGLIAVLDSFEVTEIWLNGDTKTTQTYAQFMTAVDSEGAEVYEARRGDQIEAGDLTFIVLNPVDLSGSTNNNCIVLSLSYGEVDFLFTGDAEKEAEANMLQAGIIPNVEILKVGHHGSKNASSQAFLEVVQPEVAIIMVGESNPYGHPHNETINRLNWIGAEIYRTDVNGTILVTTNGITYTVEEQPPAPELSLEIISVTTPIGQGYYATLWANTEPGAYCTITVYYLSGPSEAQGLYPKYADSNGNVSWTWKVGTRTTPGTWRIVVTASSGGETVSQTTYFTVQ